MSEKYGKLTLAKLRSELKSRNAKVSGRKAELVQRLEDYDRNFNFGQQADMEPEYAMELPPAEAYRDLNADSAVPKVTMATATKYMQCSDKQLDKVSMSLYNDRYINYVRCANMADCSYFRAQCRAQMKLTVSYHVDVCINKAGTVNECQCECAVGMGPLAHCKHIGAVLYGLCKFIECGEFTTVQTCTQTLQTFHQTKKHLGSPMKAASLMVTAKDKIDFDPRPECFRQQTTYNTFFRNTVINSGVLAQAPISEILSPANPLATLMDHDYCSLHDPIESFMKSERITHITVTEAHDVERSTTGQHTNPAWKFERLKRLTSSMFGRICKLTKADGGKLAKSLLTSRDITSAAIRHGRTYEAEAVQKYEMLTGKTTRECGVFISTQYPYLCASPDRVIDENLLVEVKCPYTSRNKHISSVTVPYLELLDGRLKLKAKHDYFYQVQGQMLCHGATCVDFVVYTLSDICIIPVERDDEFICDMIVKLSHFFQHYFRGALIDKHVAGNYFDYILCHCSQY